MTKSLFFSPRNILTAISMTVDNSYGRFSWKRPLREFLFSKLQAYRLQLKEQGTTLQTRSLKSFETFGKGETGIKLTFIFGRRHIWIISYLTTKRSILDVTAVLDPPLTLVFIYAGNYISEAKNKTKLIEGCLPEKR